MHLHLDVLVDARGTTPTRASLCPVVPIIVRDSTLQCVIQRESCSPVSRNISENPTPRFGFSDQTARLGRTPKDASPSRLQSRTATEAGTEPVANNWAGPKRLSKVRFTNGSRFRHRQGGAVPEGRLGL